MSVNWPMLRWGGHRLLSGISPDIRSVAHREFDLCPAETASARPAIYQDGALDKVTGLSPWRTWESEHALIRGGQGSHAATKAYLIDDVMLSGAFLYKKAAKAKPGYGDEKIWGPAGPKTHLNDASLVSCYGGSRFFGPFLKDSMVLELLPDPDAARIVMQTKSYGHESGYRSILSLPEPPLVHRGRIRRLTLYDDFGQNSLKAKRYRILRDRLRDRFADSADPAAAGVYLKRGATGESRLLTNEVAIENRLASLGFDIVEPAVLDAAEIARRTMGARIVVSVEGSHIAHAVYTIADDGTFVVLQPPDRFAMAFKEFADSLELGFAFLVGDPAPGGFTVDLDDLNAMVDRLS